MDIRCAVQLHNNCLLHDGDTLPICVESLVAKVYDFFYLYIVLVWELKEFCDFIDVE